MLINKGDYIFVKERWFRSTIDQVSLYCNDHELDTLEVITVTTLNSYDLFDQVIPISLVSKVIRCVCDGWTNRCQCLYKQTTDNTFKCLS